MKICPKYVYFSVIDFTAVTIFVSFFFMCFSVSATLTAMFNVGQAMKSMPEHLKACHATKAYDAHFVRTISLFTHNYFSFFTVTHSEIFTQY